MAEEQNKYIDTLQVGDEIYDFSLSANSSLTLSSLNVTSNLNVNNDITCHAINTSNITTSNITTSYIKATNGSIQTDPLNITNASVGSLKVLSGFKIQTDNIVWNNSPVSNYEDGASNLIIGRVGTNPAFVIKGTNDLREYLSVSASDTYFYNNVHINSDYMGYDLVTESAAIDTIASHTITSSIITSSNVNALEVNVSDNIYLGGLPINHVYEHNVYLGFNASETSTYNGYVRLKVLTSSSTPFTDIQTFFNTMNSLGYDRGNVLPASGVISSYASNSDKLVVYLLDRGVCFHNNSFEATSKCSFIGSGRKPESYSFRYELTAPDSYAILDIPTSQFKEIQDGVRKIT